MEKININNYPVWITDYHDGTLSGDRIEELFSFLSEHPELLEEFEQYDHATLHPDLSVRSHRKGLIRGFGELTLSQQEELTAALAEGDISGEEAEEIMSHIEASSHLTGLYRSLKNIRLVPVDIPFPGKKSLKRYPLVPQFNKAVVTILASAASIAILFSISILLNRDKPLSVPFTGFAEIDPVIITESERSNSDATAENIAEISEEAESSQNSDPGKSLSEINSTAENETRAISSTDKDNRSEVIAKTGTSAGSSEDISADTRAENKAESNNRSINEQPGGYHNLALIRVHSTPSINERASATAQLAEMVPVEVTEDIYTGSPREFIAKNFRKLVFDDHNASSERLKPIELADATVTGINKLLGWEMKLEKKSDDNGTLNSISFASHLVNFDHNLKNSGN